MEPKTQRLSLLASVVSSVLAVAFVVLFLWHSIGISYLIFVLLLLVGAIAPYLVYEEKPSEGFTRRYGFFALAIVAPAFVFIFRFDELARFWSFIFAALAYSIFIVKLYHPNALKNLGIGFLLKLPFILLSQYFQRWSQHSKEFRVNLIKKFDLGHFLKRALLGFVISVPFLLIFFVLFASSDSGFSRVLGDMIDKVVSFFFVDFSDFVSFLVKVFIGFLVYIYLLIFHFFSWMEKSELATRFENIKDYWQEEYKKDWDYVIVSTVLFFINLLFVSFVLFQAGYLFKGEANVIGADANFTYADYARKGFVELIIASGLVYAILLVLNVKTGLTDRKSRLAFATMSNFLALLTLIISGSVIYRIILLQDVYGFTFIRTWGLIGTVSMIVMIVLSMVQAWGADYLKKSSQSIAFALLTVLGIYAFFPMDLYLAKMNYNRFQSSGMIDLAYMVNLNDEALPVLVDLAEDKSLSEVGRAIVIEKLLDRERDYSSDFNWRSYSPWNSYYYDKVSEFRETKAVDVRESLRDFLTEYFDYLKEEGFEGAHEKYWSSSTIEKASLGSLDRIAIKDVSIYNVPTFSNLNLVNYRTDTGDYAYWNGTGVSVDVEYLVQGESKERCTNFTIYVKLEDGQWKVSDSGLFVLGEFNGVNEDAPYRYQYVTDSDLFNEPYCDGSASWDYNY